MSAPAPARQPLQTEKKWRRSNVADLEESASFDADSFVTLPWLTYAEAIFFEYCRPASLAGSPSRSRLGPHTPPFSPPSLMSATLQSPRDPHPVVVSAEQQPPREPIAERRSRLEEVECQSLSVRLPTPRRDETGRQALLRRIVSEFEEIPGTALTVAQASACRRMGVGESWQTSLVSAYCTGESTGAIGYRLGHKEGKITAMATARRTSPPKSPRSKVVAMPTAPARGHEEVARRATTIFLARGATHGRDLEDWLVAEREMKRTAS